VLNSPLANFSARPLIYSALRCESPAVRRVVISAAATCEGVGKICSSSGVGEFGLKSATNLAWMDFAAAPET
jgi:hypothetical protein